MRRLSKYYLVMALVAALAVGCGSDEVSENDQQNVEQNQNDPEQNDPEQNQNDPEQNQNDPEQNQNDPEENQNDPEENQNDPEENQNDPEENQEEGEPELEISGEEALSWTLEIGMSESAQFEVGNVGDAALEFDVSTGEEWLSFDPETGEVDDGEHLAVEAEATCPDEVGEYSATVVVSSDGGDAEFDAELVCEPLKPGTLEVVVEGLPEFQDADISVEGPDGFAEDVVETAVFDEAPVGAYTVTAREVGEDAVYVPESTEETVEVERDGDSSVTIEYEPVLGGVLVDVEGLPSGAEPDLTLVQNGEEWEVPDNGLLQDLVPGDYTLSGDDYEDGGTLYEASDTAVTIISDEVVDVTISYLIDPGYLEVDVSGLPQGASHEINVVADSDGEVTELPTSGELTLEPDTYHVEPQVVNAGLADYEAEGETVVIESGELVEVDVDYEVILGELPVVISGDLPAGVDADVDLNDGEGQSTKVEQSGTVALVPGVYDVDAHDVVVDITTYEATAATPETVAVESGENGELEIEYELVPATLHIDITGELDGNNPDVDLIWPDSFSQTLTDSDSFELDPGEYTVDADDVDDGPAIYEASGGETLTLESGDEKTVTVEYALITVDIVVTLDEFGDVDYELELNGPDGFSEPIDGDASFSDERPGFYEVVVVSEPVDEYGNDSYVDIDPPEFDLESGDDPQVVAIEVRAANIVTTEVDGGPGSLRFVLGDVAEETVVEFADDVSEIVLTGGQITVDKELNIVGRSEDPVVLDGDDAGRIFRLNASASLAVVDMIIQHGVGEPGGAVRIVDDGEFLAARVEFLNNTSSTGGVALVEDDGLFYAQDSLFANNVAENWGAVVATRDEEEEGDEASTVFIRRSLIENNISQSAGGALDTTGELLVEQSTFVGNESASMGSAITVFEGDADLEGVTVIDNENDGVYAALGADEVKLRASIVAENEDDDLGGTLATFESGGYNVLGDVPIDYEEGPGDQTGVEDAGLEELADNGGFTETMALTEESPARSVMAGGECAENATLVWYRDQRFQIRPAGAFCSAGAYEVDALVETFSTLGDDMNRGTYDSGSFVGSDGIEWEFEDTRRQEEDEENDEYYIEGTSVILHGPDQGQLHAEGLSGDIESLSFLAAQATKSPGSRHVEVLVDGTVIGESSDLEEYTGSEEPPFPVHLITVQDIGEVGSSFDLTIRSSGDEHVVVDNISLK